MPAWDEMLEVARRLQARVGGAARSGAVDAQLLSSAAQVRPGEPIPAFAAMEEAADAPTGPLQLAAFTWGYLLQSKGKLVYNARIENASGAMWADSFASRRAIVPAAAFFEPHKAETERNPRTGRMVARPYEFRPTQGTPMLLGAVYQDDRISIVTTEPNAPAARVHRRMPLVLSFDEVSLWFGENWGALADRSAIELAVAPEHPASRGSNQLSLF